MYLAVSFLGVQFKSKHLRGNKKELSFCKNFDLRFLFWQFFEQSKTLWPETCHHNFLSATYFSVHPIETCCQLFLLQEKRVSSFYQMGETSSTISHFFGSGTWTIMKNSHWLCNFAGVVRLWCNASVSFKHQHLPGQTPGEFFEVVKSSATGQNFAAKACPP